MAEDNSKGKNTWFFVTVILIVAVILIGVSYWQLSGDSKEEEQIDKTYDDSISPLENQALFVEVLRIRNRGLMDKMLSYGSSWQEHPSFYYTIRVDDESGSAKGNVGEDGIFHTYDTIGFESAMTFDVNEERETSKVVISIIEEQYTGLSGRNVVEEEVEKITLHYDYRTGLWTGDDSFRDNDGMRHYLGDTYELWFNIYQADYDHDGIPYWIERNVLETDPTVDDSKLDPDNDGIPTDWEWQFGYDPFVYNDHENLDPDIDGIQNIEEYQMRNYFSNPFQQDMYMEADGMEKNGALDMDHVFYKESQQMIIERFAQYGIWVYIDDGWEGGPVNGGGEILPFQKNLDDTNGKQVLSFYTHHFADERKGVFRYIVVGSINGGFITAPQYNCYDTMYIGNNIAASITRLAFTQREVRVQLAKAILHETGHSIGLMPWTFPGNDIYSRSISDRYPNMPDEDYEGYLTQYYSIMNYQYIYNKPFLWSDGSYLFDFSDGSNGAPYDQDDWVHVYVPAFQMDAGSYEEPSDESFEDFDIVIDYPGVVAEGWEYNENLTAKYSKEFESLALITNAEAEIQVFEKIESEDDAEYNVRVYAKPMVGNVYSIHSLVAEGNVDADDIVDFYSKQHSIELVKDSINKES